MAQQPQRATPTTFVERVRDGRVPLPTHLVKFTAAKWQAEFSAAADSSHAAERLRTSGLWINARLSALEARAKSLRFGHFDKGAQVRMHCGYANRESAFVLRDAKTTGARAHDDTFVAEHLASAHIASATGAVGTPDDFLESITDGLKISLDSLRRGFPADPIEPAETLEAIRLHVNLGVMYSAYLNIWNDCLWNDWFIDTSGAKDVVRPANDAVERGFALARFRSQRLIPEIIYSAAAAWTRLPEQFREHTRAENLHVVEVAGSGKTRRVRTGILQPTTLPPFDVLTRIVTDELFFTGLVDVPLPTYPELTVATLARGWETLRELSNELAKRWPLQNEIKSPRQLAEFSQVFSRAEFCSLFRDCADASPSAAASMFNLLLRGRDESTNDIWLRPIETVAADTYILAAAPLETSSLVRLTEHWMRVGGVSLDERGPEFEKFARERLQESISLSSIRSRIGVFPGPLTLHFPGESVEEEEIDLVLWVGDSVLIGELKCILHPSGPMAERHYFSTLTDGAKQIARKAASATRHREVIATALRNHVTLDSTRLRIIPVVIPSSPLAVGLRFGDVSVADVSVLSRYFDRGFIEHATVKDAQGRTVAPGFKTPFYASDAGAESALEDYLSDPPQLRLERQALVTGERPLPQLSSDDRPAAMMTFEVNFARLTEALIRLRDSL